MDGYEITQLRNVEFQRSDLIDSYNAPFSKVQFFLGKIYFYGLFESSFEQ